MVGKQSRQEIPSQPDMSMAVKETMTGRPSDRLAIPPKSQPTNRQTKVHREVTFRIIGQNCCASGAKIYFGLRYYGPLHIKKACPHDYVESYWASSFSFTDNPSVTSESVMVTARPARARSSSSSSSNSSTSPPLRWVEKTKEQTLEYQKY